MMFCSTLARAMLAVWQHSQILVYISAACEAIRRCQVQSAASAHDGAAWLGNRVAQLAVC